MWIEFTKEWLFQQERSQAWLARQARISDEHLSQCLCGHRTPGPRTLARLERAMNLPVGHLSVDEAVLTQQGIDDYRQRAAVSNPSNGAGE